MRLASRYCLGLLCLVGCGDSDPLLGPEGLQVPLTLENLTGRWEETARIYFKLGAQTGVVRDTTPAAAADRIIYQFNLDGPGIVRRVQPNPDQALLVIEGTGDGFHWSMGTQFESFSAILTANRLSLNDGSSNTLHHFDGDPAPVYTQVVHVFARTAAP